MNKRTTENNGASIEIRREKRKQTNFFARNLSRILAHWAQDPNYAETKLQLLNEKCSKNQLLKATKWNLAPHLKQQP